MLEKTKSTEKINLDMKNKVFKMIFNLEHKAFEYKNSGIPYDKDFINTIIKDLKEILYIAEIDKVNEVGFLDDKFNRDKYIFELSRRQQNAFARCIKCLIDGDIAEAIHTLYEFLDNYGRYRECKDFSMFEKYIAYALITNIIYSLEQKLEKDS
ncbi:hypothetical protein [Clostridium perfringens]|uniref:hypothetical protein n=1 Tax=Clostridium perfringens TaxID=1502 RepID=UPI003F43BF9B